MTKPTTEKNDILTRLTRIYRKFSRARRIDGNSHMCQFWIDPTVEILVGSDELDTIESEFGIEFDDETAMRLYDMILVEAAVFIGNMVSEQNAGAHDPDKFVTSMAPKFAKKVLLAFWREREDLRPAIKLAAAESECE
jgi:hypothetical protein